MSNFVIPQPWGAKYHTGIKEHSGWFCPHCIEPITTASLTDHIGWYKSIVGFSKEIPGGSVRSGSHRGDTEVVGCVIVECPHCYEKYFIHATIREIKRAMETTPAWPKATK